jgi:hypothetical protein
MWKLSPLKDAKCCKAECRVGGDGPGNRVDIEN